MVTAHHAPLAISRISRIGCAASTFQGTIPVYSAQRVNSRHSAENEEELQAIFAKLDQKQKDADYYGNKAEPRQNLRPTRSVAKLCPAFLALFALCLFAFLRT